jgi:hypothetical protein
MRAQKQFGSIASLVLGDSVKKWNDADRVLDGLPQANQRLARWMRSSNSAARPGSACNLVRGEVVHQSVCVASPGWVSWSGMANAEQVAG